MLARKRKALMFYGTGHLRRDTPYASSVELVERDYPGAVIVVTPYVGRRAGDTCTPDPAADARMRGWPAPAVVPVRDTWLMDLVRQEAQSRPAMPMFAPKPPPDPARAIDAYLHLGPPGLLLREPPSVFTFADAEFLKLLHDRQAQLGRPTIDSRTDPAVVARQDTNMLQCARSN